MHNGVTSTPTDGWIDMLNLPLWYHSLSICSSWWCVDHVTDSLHSSPAVKSLYFSRITAHVLQDPWNTHTHTYCICSTEWHLCLIWDSGQLTYRIRIDLLWCNSWYILFRILGIVAKYMFYHEKKKMITFIVIDLPPYLICILSL